MANSSALPFPIPSGGEDVVPLDEGIRFCGSLCTKSEGLELRKGPKTWCKGNGEIRFCGDSCTKSEAAERRTTETRRRKSSARHASGPDSLFFRNERSRCIKCTAASLIAYIGRRGMCTVKVVPLPGMLST